MAFNDEAADEPGATAIEEYHANLAAIGINAGPGSAQIRSPASMGILDWMDYPLVVAAYAHSFPHNGPMEKRSQDWEDQVYPSTNPKTKQPSGPNEGVLLS
jgi:hypothetical protein